MGVFAVPSFPYFVQSACPSACTSAFLSAGFAAGRISHTSSSTVFRKGKTFTLFSTARPLPDQRGRDSNAAVRHVPPQESPQEGMRPLTGLTSGRPPVQARSRRRRLRARASAQPLLVRPLRSVLHLVEQRDGGGGAATCGPRTGRR